MEILQMNRFSKALSFACVLAISGAVNADVVYSTGTPDGFFTPFVSTTPAGMKYGDSGWFGTGSSPAVALTEITLGLSTFSNTAVPAGSADIIFTLNDGDPSGLVFGSGATLYSTTITHVTLPASDGLASNFDLTIPLPNVMTSGGFNNIGWSVGVANFNYAGQFGFQDKGNFNAIGFMTANASEYNPSTGQWSLFSFGPSFPSDSPNFVARISTPEPASLSALAALGLLTRRRR